MFIINERGVLKALQEWEECHGLAPHDGDMGPMAYVSPRPGLKILVKGTSRLRLNPGDKAVTV